MKRDDGGLGNALTRIMNETVEYGGLLVPRFHMHADLLAKGVVVNGKSSPAGFAYMSRPAIAASPEWDFVDGEFHHRLSPNAIGADGRPYRRLA